MTRRLGTALLSTAAFLTWSVNIGAQTQPPIASAQTTPEASPASSPSLGRLFYTPAQRATLDEMRRRPQKAAATEEKAPRPPAPEYVTLNGVVRRSDGTTTVWLNDRQVRGRESQEGLLIAPARRTAAPNHVTVRVPETGRIVELKVGQQLEVNSGAVKESYRAPRRPSPMAQAPASKPPVEQTTLRDRRSAREREELREMDGTWTPPTRKSPAP